MKILQEGKINESSEKKKKTAAASTGSWWCWLFFAVLSLRNVSVFWSAVRNDSVKHRKRDKMFPQKQFGSFCSSSGPWQSYSLCTRCLFGLNLDLLLLVRHRCFSEKKKTETTNWISLEDRRHWWANWRQQTFSVSLNVRKATHDCGVFPSAAPF